MTHPAALDTGLFSTRVDLRFHRNRRLTSPCLAGLRNKLRQLALRCAHLVNTCSDKATANELEGISAEFSSLLSLAISSRSTSVAADGTFEGSRAHRRSPHLTRKTSVSLEREFWDGLREIAVSQGTNIKSLVKQIGQGREDGTNLSSAIRVFVFNGLLAVSLRRPLIDGKKLNDCSGGERHAR